MDSATSTRSISPAREARIESLADNPRPAGAEELRGLSGVFRVWLNGWRIIYQVIEDDSVLLIVGIRYKTGPETYDNLELD